MPTPTELEFLNAQKTMLIANKASQVASKIFNDINFAKQQAEMQKRIDDLAAQIDALQL